MILAAKRALDVSVVLGGVLVFAVGGLHAPVAGMMIRVSVLGFFFFWVVFAVFFQPARPIDNPPRGNASPADSADTITGADRWSRSETRVDHGFHHSGSGGGTDHGGGGHGGDGGH
ncbi:MAG: hypothetical protein R3D05_16215 [Dongiaceae bacterium]